VTAGHRGRRHATIDLPGGSIAYTIAGAGDAVVLIHGLGGDRQTWDRVVDTLALTHTVIAPDLPGHGQSDAPAGDYSLGAHATAVRDLLLALGRTSATIAGHSLGGGVGLQFVYQFPQHVDRLVLISSGGLGPEVSPLLRAATLPGASAVIAGVTRLPPSLGRTVLPLMSVVPGLLARQDVRPLARTLQTLGSSRRRRAFVHTARSVIDWRGQTVSATGHLGLLTDIPVLTAWGSDDRTIPPDHHREFSRTLPSAHPLEVPGAGHFPHETAPARLLPALCRFLRDTEAFRLDPDRWRQLLTGSSSRPIAEPSPMTPRGAVPDALPLDHEPVLPRRGPGRPVRGRRRHATRV
jgi:pimeloyl-ACP methyl ester carboxylesterase